MDALRFGLALLVGRGLRFGALALLGARYGAQAEAYVKENLAWVSVLAALLVVVWTVIYRRLIARPAAAASEDAPRSSPSAGS